MIRSILVVCVGNICRSPVGERLLAEKMSGVDVSSAGIGALVGKPADSVATDVARENGLSLEGHIARQFDPADAAEKDLILVMEKGHLREVTRKAPQLSGRTMLYDHWVGREGIPDPYRMSADHHRDVFQKILKAADAWAERLAPVGADR